MAGFRKAKAEQAAIKMGVYGPPGSGKTLTSLLVAEGLAGVAGKRIAFVDTERGTDFYCKAVPERVVHPDAFDFDALYTRSIVEILEAIEKLDPSTYGVVVIDSISHVWDAAMAAYKGKRTSIGTIPMSAWGEIKKPYKALMAALLSSPIHVIICGRQANEMAENETGDMTKVGVKMRAEGETQYEPHITIRMEATRAQKGKPSEVLAIVEKDRTGILQGKVIPSPNFDRLVKPILPLLGETQAKVETEDETGQRDADAMVKAEHDRARDSQKLLVQLRADMDRASTISREELDAASKRITPAIKKQMLPSHVAELREHYQRLVANAPAAAAVTSEEVTA